MFDGFLALPLMAQAAVAPGSFAPPLDTPLRYVITETRTKGRETRRFTAERRIVFRRDGDNIVAEVTLDHIDQQAGDGAGAMFETAMAGLQGRTIRFHLDRAGKLITVEDRDALWERLCDAMAAMGDKRSRPGLTKTVATALRALPGDRRQAMLGSMIAPLIAGDAAPKNDSAVSVSARTPTGAPTALDGRQSVSHSADGTLTVQVRAEGNVATGFPGETPGIADAPKAGVHLSVMRDNRIDPRTGLVLESRQTTRTTIGSGAGARRSEAVTTATLTSLVF